MMQPLAPAPYAPPLVRPCKINQSQSQRRNRSRGLSLVSLLVGTSICLLLAVATLHLFKSVTYITLSTSQGAQADSQRSSAMLASSFLVQGAGFGIDNASLGADLLLLGKAQLQAQQLTGTAASTTGNAFIWRTAHSPANAAAAQTQCEALYIESTDNAAQPKGLYHLTATHAPCPADMRQAQWSQMRPLALGDGFEMALQATGCSPFGQAQPQQQLAFTLTAHNSADIALSETVCLANFPLAP